MAKGNRGGKRAGGSGKSPNTTKFSQKELDNAVFEYTTSRYMDINGGLRDGKVLNKSNRDIANKLDYAINNSTIKDGTTLYRGTTLESLGLSGSVKNLKVSDLKNLEGKTITDNAFMSTSTSQKSASIFSGRSMNTSGNVEFVINVNGNKKGLNVGKNSNFGDKENEVLLPRNANLKVTKVKRRLNKLTVYVDY